MKRLVDVIIAAFSLVVFAPVMLVVALVVKNKMGSPVLFRQRRPGLGGQPFELIKFRTMRTVDPRTGKILPDAERLTDLGKFLRSSSLDELPELWLVLKGEMSLVGPRPLLMEYLPLYTAEQSRRHDVKPGLTGWAQVNGRNGLSWEDKFKLDVWYVENHNLLLDFRILWMTVKAVVARDGINSDGHATMPPFSGNGSST
jgi:lipopolysaccharide/colanic/teichoic acid biosynthesis glycosyltransferase